MQKIYSKSQKLILPLKTFPFPSRSIKQTRKIFDSKPVKIERINTSISTSIQDKSCTYKVKSLITSFNKPSLSRSRTIISQNPLFSRSKLASPILSRSSSKLSKSRNLKTSSSYLRLQSIKNKSKNHVQASFSKTKDAFQDWDLDESFTVVKPTCLPKPKKTKILKTKSDKKVLLAWIPQPRQLTIFGDNS